MAAEEHYLLALLFIIHFTFSASFDTITVNQTIWDGGSLLISKERNFALGFFSPGNSRFRYVGIWYHKVRRRTVVWVANRNNPINGSSGVMAINQDGNLVLYSDRDRKVAVWSTNVSVEESNTCVAELWDSGNLVLLEETSRNVLWQSFDYPTDTMLPGMKLGLNKKTGFRRFLSSWRSPDDPGIGEYSVEVTATGPPQIFVYKSKIPIWRSVLWPTSAHKDLRNYSFVNNQEEVSIAYFIVDPTVILTSILDPSGFHKHVTWHEMEGKWKEIWMVPRSQCDTYGNCGTNSKCSPTLANRIFECDCLAGFEPQFPRDWNVLRDGSGGCVRKRAGSYKMCSPGGGFLKMEHVKIPDTSAAIWIDISGRRHNCEQECGKNCSCTAYASIDFAVKRTGCFLWFAELMDVVNRIDDGYDLYVRVDAIELASRQSNRFFTKTTMLSIFIPSVASAWLMIILLAYLLLKRKRRRVRDKWKKRFLATLGDSFPEKDATEGRDVTSHLDIAFFDLTTIVAATNDFSVTNKLGQGGFGSVYKGQLVNGQKIAVKRLGENSRQGIGEFKTEVILTAKLQHKNLVKLLGCCIDGEEPMLIYEYLSNKSLDLLLFEDEARRSILDWRTRFEIIVGIARGILYLHQDSRLRIIHRDLKTSNILLDEEMNAKISDLGMARMFKGNQLQDKTSKIAGTFGYMSPEYVNFGKYSVKSDVFSYGVILLEIVSGKRNSSFYEEDSSLNLITYVWELWEEGRALDMVDPLLKESNMLEEEEGLRFIQVGLLCVQEAEKDRPTMFNVVLMLNSEISIPCPKQPAFTVSRNTPHHNPCSINHMTITSILTR